MDEEIPTESVPEVPETPTQEESPAEETPEIPVAEEETDAGQTENNEGLPTESGETTTPGAELPTTDELELPMHPQMFSTDYITDDYMITLIHELTLGDILIATLLCVLIIVQVLKIMLRRW